MAAPQPLPSEHHSQGQPRARPADSFLQLRRWLGIIATLLPFVLVLGNVFLRAVLKSPPEWRGWDLQRSMSAYYYTDMQNVFVGALVTIGAFLLAYKGRDKREARAGTIAGISAVIVGLLPTVAPDRPFTVISDLHIAFAALLYLTLAYISIWLFPRPEAGARRRDPARNAVYRICGWTIIACLVLIAVAEEHFVRASVGSYRPAFWLESLATVAFGVSWLTKGEKIFRDASSEER
jgi:hypothetical protein